MTIQEGHEEQQGTQSKSQETLMAELQAERNKTTTIHEELQILQTSYQDINYKYEAEAATNIKVKNGFKEEKRAPPKDPLTTELQAEQHKNLSLQQQLEKLWASGQNVSKPYEAEISAARQQSAELHKELQN